MSGVEKPVPTIHSWTAPYWKGAKEGKLIIQRCRDCKKHIFYPRIWCPFCMSDQIDWVNASGKGKIYSYTVVQNNPPSAFVKDLPFTIAIVRLEEGVQMLTNIVGCDPQEVKCDMPVEVIFEKYNDEITLPKFRPVLR